LLQPPTAEKFTHTILMVIGLYYIAVLNDL
jgi:hypothetical protein